MKQCAQNWWRFYEYDLKICIQRKILYVTLPIIENKNIYLTTSLQFITE